VTRARSLVAEIDADITAAVQVLRDAVAPQIVDGNDIDHALCGFETFVVIALHVMRHSNPSKIREAAQIVEIRARMDGVPVIERRAL
jgi:hypothetical protein